MPVITCIEDFRRLARRRVPRAFYDYVDSGSYTESTYRANSLDLAALRLRQRVGIDVDARSLAGQMLGQPVTLPLALAPTGLTGMQWANGEMLAARAAERFGIPFTLSTMSICSIEDVAEATRRPFWFQLYMMRDREFIDRLIARAEAVGCSALMLTLDLQIMGQRHKDLHNGLSVPLQPSLAALFDLACKPGWVWRALGARKSFGNLAGHVAQTSANASAMNHLGRWIASQFDPTLSWTDVAWLRQRWKGKLILKGILDAEDALRAVDSGADALVVSNHGGRQLDGAVSSIRALPAIRQATGDRIEVWMDGGIRSGQDILKALASGASAVLAGRAFLYALGAMGEAGVTKMLEILRAELDVSMALCGVRSLDEIGSHILQTQPAG